MENGIDPGNLSPSQLVSFERQTLEVQQKSIQIYAANVAKAQAKLGTSNRKA
jgi:U3 small nucleolar ribonucleoprotein component